MGIAVLFIAQDAEFLAAVQIIVYAGAIVVLFLFVIMLIGVDRSDNLRIDPLAGQKAAAAIASVVLGLGLAGVVLLGKVTGEPGAVAPNVEGEPNTEAVGRVLFTDHLLAFEITSILLIIGVVGAVTLARHRNISMVDDDHPGDEIPAGSEEEVAS
jgi:NADH-quinone oxidoreductase subunit J